MAGSDYDPGSIVLCGEGGNHGHFDLATFLLSQRCCLHRDHWVLFDRNISARGWRYSPGPFLIILVVSGSQSASPATIEETVVKQPDPSVGAWIAAVNGFGDRQGRMKSVGKPQRHAVPNTTPILVSVGKMKISG
ncbi:hypothetical protein ACOJBM_01885 [Rhizobium beringeri]